MRNSRSFIDKYLRKARKLLKMKRKNRKFKRKGAMKTLRNSGKLKKAAKDSTFL